MRKLLIILVFALAACGGEDRYAAGVAGYQPIYCYKVLTDIQCHPEPDHDGARRLVNYFGPPPSAYEAPEKPPKAELFAPAKIDYWVKDPEPMPEPQVYLPMKSSLPARLSELTPALEAPAKRPAATAEAPDDSSAPAPAPPATPAGEVRIETPE